MKEINNYLRGLRKQTDDGEIEISGYNLFDLWLNGTIFHHDTEAHELFSSLGILNDLTETNFTKYIGLYSNFIIHLSGIIESGLNTKGFDILNKLSPHFDAKFVLAVGKPDKAAVIKFWEGTKNTPQTLAICEIHDQDPVIAITNFDEYENDGNLESTKVEIKSCCQDAANNALKRIHNALAWINYLEKHGQKQAKPIEIMEIPVTNINEAQIIKITLDDYRLIWRRKIGNMRCPVHHLPPGVRGFGIDLFMQGDGNQTDFVFLQVAAENLYKNFLPDQNNN